MRRDAGWTAHAPSSALIILRAGSRVQKLLVASNVIWWLRSEIQGWIGTKQKRTFLKKNERRRHVVKDQEGKAGGKQSGLRESTAEYVERAPALITYLGEVVPAEIAIRISLKHHAPQRVPSDALQAISQIFDALSNCNMNISSM
jgi:hypothetical protein